MTNTRFSVTLKSVAAWPAAVGTIGHVGNGPTTLTAAIAPLLSTAAAPKAEPAPVDAVQQAIKKLHMLLMPFPAQEVTTLEVCKVVSERALEIIGILESMPQPATQEDALTPADADQLEKAITDFFECGETDVPYEALQRFAAMGYLECIHYNVLPAAYAAIDAARTKEGASNAN